MKIPKLAVIFLMAVCLVVYLTYVKRCFENRTLSRPLLEQLYRSDLRKRPTSAEMIREMFRYGIMFDAGSTGTRIHIFKFQQDTNAAPKLSSEMFKAIKPGLSAYADEPEKLRTITYNKLLQCKTGLLELLDVAKQTVPPAQWSSAPLALRATAGLRLLPGQKATHLLDKVVFMDLMFPQWACWIWEVARPSYLGLGLMSARLAVLGGVEGQPVGGGQELVSPCLAPDYIGEWEHAEVTYTLKGQKAGEPIYESCLSKVEKMIYKRVTKAEEVKNMEFYAFSYYYDRAVDLGLVDERDGGSLRVSNYIDGAKTVTDSNLSVFQLARKINEVETSWALGATFYYMESLHKH
ncbi:Ectonucleoside triphosphate diphosphohydrolase 6 [Bagarius yarrelli]|uniref:Ectonucleoside triphosphate diphosphohydrolase 6 n=1 Tax=Bagarius yarrelli TaxID=175774 RepID=A0A556V377_BAGYA|nr:Ectonucleoside triphosphate diphosphohydrolase 6 [Bagarius yarrelli]